MSIRYRVYSNPISGGPVDFTAPLGDTALLTFDTPPLPGGTDFTFAVVAYDTGTGLEDRSADARVRVVLAADGSDATGLPLAPRSLHARALAGGAARFTWAYPPAGGAAGFHLYLWPASGTPDYTAPAAALSARPGLTPGDSSPRASFSLTVTGLTGGAAYLGAVRAYNAAGEEQNTAAAAVTAADTGPSPVVGLAATVSA